VAESQPAQIVDAGDNTDVIIGEDFRN